MRTTLTLDDDVAQQLTELSHSQRKAFKQVVNETLRRGLGTPGSNNRKPFKVKPFLGKLQPGIDPRGFNKLYDELEAEAFLEKFGKNL